MVVSKRGQLNRCFLSEEEKQESIKIDNSAPEGAIISNQAPAGRIYTMLVVKFSDEVEGCGEN